MKKKWDIISSILQVIVGVAAIVSFLILGLGGENVTKWIITLIAAIVYTVLGCIGIVRYFSK